MFYIKLTPQTLYSEVVKFVGEFLCGVGDVGEALDGATFTVTLRLTNPDNESETVTAAQVNHVFKAPTSTPADGE